MISINHILDLLQPTEKCLLPTKTSSVQPDYLTSQSDYLSTSPSDDVMTAANLAGVSLSDLPGSHLTHLSSPSQSITASHSLLEAEEVDKRSGWPERPVPLLSTSTQPSSKKVFFR